MQNKIQKIAIGTAIKAFSIAKFIIKPDNNHYSKVYSFSLSMIKLASFERSKISSEFFDSYYKQLEKAKNEKTNAFIKPNLEKLGEVVELAKIANVMTALILALIFFSLATSFGAMGIVALQKAAFGGSLWTFKNVIVGVLTALSTFWTFYYLVKALDFKISEEMLKTYLQTDFTYIFAKASEIDDDVADETFQFVKETILLENEKIETAEKNIKKILNRRA